MRAHINRSVFVMCILLTFGIDRGGADIFAQGTEVGGPSEVENLKKQISQMEEQLRQLRQKVDQLDKKPLRTEPFAQSLKEPPNVDPDEQERRLRDLECQVQQ